MKFILSTLSSYLFESPLLLSRLKSTNRITTGLFCQFVVLNLSVNGYVLETVLVYNFEHNKQLAFGWLFIIALYTVLTSPNKDETAVYG